MTAIPESISTPPAHDPASILDHFADLADPRREQGRIHRLDEIIFMATCAMFCGADTWEQVAGYAHSKIDWLQTILTLPGGIPSHDTFRRVFCLLDPAVFQKCFYSWLAALMRRRGLTPLAMDPPALRPIAIDGKTQRGSARRTVGRSAFARRQRLGRRESFGSSGSTVRGMDTDASRCVLTRPRFHPTKTYFDSWIARIFSLKNSRSRNPYACRFIVFTRWTECPARHTP